jgi:hypothetical protein
MGPVAQLDRASPSEGEGRTFESCRVRQSFQIIRTETSVLGLGIATSKRARSER